MAYEVTKTIAGRAYRYQVESVRDPETGKRRNRWTYLGRAGNAPRAETAPKRPRGEARGRLLDALERLLAERDFSAVTADAIAVEAGLAHGTFYRHFSDKRAALHAALERVRDRRQLLAELSALSREATASDARAGVRAFVALVLHPPVEHHALIRASFVLGLRDEEFAAARRERRTLALRVLDKHLATLTRRGIADVRNPRATAGAILALVDGLYRESLVDGMALDEARIEAAVEMVERAVFGESERKRPT